MALRTMSGFPEQCEWRPAPGVAARAGGTAMSRRRLLDCLAGEAVVDDVMKRDPAPRMNRLVELDAARRAR